MFRTLLALVGLLGLSIGLTAPSQAASNGFFNPAPGFSIADNGPNGYYGSNGPYNSYDGNRDRDDRQSLTGIVTYFHRFRLSVRTRSYDLPISLHQGTIINPRGVTLEPDMLVSIRGYWDNGTFRAERIDVLRYGYQQYEGRGY